MILKKDIQQLTTYLRQVGWLSAEEAIEELSVPGEGNMNFTLRVKTGSKTAIIKQSRNYVEKYPQVAAPAGRAMQEYAFYQRISGDQELAARTPGIYHADANNNILLMQDLGAGTDYTAHYDSHADIEAEDLDKIVDFLIRLHSDHQLAPPDSPIRNMEMRKLNHEHMYVYPMTNDNGLNLDAICEGLQAVAEKVRANIAVVHKMQDLGQLYLGGGDTLLHGDYFLGSWLKAEGKIYIIDPEFCHHGRPEFEVAVLIAHLHLAQQSQAVVDHVLERYVAGNAIDLALTHAFAGGEIIRRLIGLAQLPLQATLSQRTALLDRAQEMILHY